MSVELGYWCKLEERGALLYMVCSFLADPPPFRRSLRRAASELDFWVCERRAVPRALYALARTLGLVI